MGVGESNFNDFLDRFFEMDNSAGFSTSTGESNSKSSGGAAVEVDANLDFDSAVETGLRRIFSSNWELKPWSPLR